jgi:hypothetical protein
LKAKLTKIGIDNLLFLAMSNQVSLGERNPIDGKFEESKRRFGLVLIQAKLLRTSETWIALFDLLYENNRGLLFQQTLVIRQVLRRKANS